MRGKAIVWCIKYLGHFTDFKSEFVPTSQRQFYIRNIHFKLIKCLNELIILHDNRICLETAVFSHLINVHLQNKC